MDNVIEVNLNAYKDAINIFDNDRLSTDLAKFIYNRSMAIPFNQDVKIQIKATCKLSKSQKQNIIDMIHSYFNQEIKKAHLISKQKSKSQVFLFILGIILISLTNLRIFSALNIIRELYLIAGWVIIWELVYNMLFEDIKKDMQLKRYKKLAKAEISYI